MEIFTIEVIGQFTLISGQIPQVIGQFLHFFAIIKFYILHIEFIGQFLHFSPCLSLNSPQKRECLESVHFLNILY